MLQLVSGMLFGSALTFMILDDYYKDKIIEYWEKKEAEHYINEADKITKENKKWKMRE